MDPHDNQHELICGRALTLPIKNDLNGFLLFAASQLISGIGDPYRIRTDVNGVRGRCLNHLTNGPFGPLSGTRTRDPLIKSQLLYQLS